MECRPRIYYDRREESSTVPATLRQLGAAVIPKLLTVGDYVVSDRVVFERKSLRDLVRSVFDGRLFDQARRLSEAYEAPIIIVEGVRGLAKLGDKKPQFYMALMSVSLDYGVRIFFVDGEGETARIIYYTACREQCREGGRPVVIHRKPKMDQLWMKQLYLVQSIPGIGPKLAEKLLEYFGSIEAVCKASIVELERVLGPSRARQVYRIIHAPYTPPRQGRRQH
ncbi:MAG: hypothetical protein GXO09_01185 [Crenarchaeota archaeon]|nr:hypothetical protein [Thermoproteota archaeon]